MGNAAVALRTRARVSRRPRRRPRARDAHRARRWIRRRRDASFLPPRSASDAGARRHLVVVTRARASMPRETNVTRVGPYALGRTLGKGAFGCGKLGVHDKTGVKVAVKVRIRAREGDGRARDDGCRTIRERDAPRCFVDDSALERARIAGKVTRVSCISSDARRLTRERALERALEPDR